jgi:hypothetical protein
MNNDFGKMHGKVVVSYFTMLSWNLAGRIDPLNAEVNTISHLLALLGTHPILHISRTRVKDNNKISVNITLVQADI